MGVIWTPGRNLSQPYGELRLRSDHPFIAKGSVRGIWVPWSQRNLIDKSLIEPAYTTARIGSGPLGRGFITGSGSKWVGGYDITTLKREISIAAWLTTGADVTQAYAGVASCNGATLAGHTAGVGLAVDAVGARVYLTTAGGPLSSNYQTLVANRTQFIAGSIETLVGSSGYVSLADYPLPPLATAKGSSAGGFPTGRYEIQFGGDARGAYSASRYIESVMYCVIAVERYVEPEEWASIAPSPWQLFEADNDPVFYSLGGGGAAALEGSLAASGTVSGALTTAIQAAALVSASASVTAALTTGIPLAASLSGSATVSAAITTAIQLNGSLSATASVTGDISGAAALASSVSTSAIVTGDLTTAIRLNASVSGAATVTGVLAEPGAAAALEASIAASATVSASLTGGSSTIWTPASASSGTWTPASASSGTWTQA